jgi:tRNA-uridine 2-sulfurtransferase
MRPSTPVKVVVAMSGGVDSSVAAALLKRQGYHVIGVFLRLGSPKGVQLAEHDGRKQGCCSVLDADDARRVAQVLDVPFYVLNFEEEFGKVIDYFVAEYNRGRTPNPCIRCNDWLKFGRLAQYAQAVGAEFVASGHYARIGVDPVTGRRALLRGVDHAKDQSDVLFGITPAALEHTLFPIGDYQKKAVREIAQELNLPVFNKPDSQEICFVPDQDYAGLVRRHAPDQMREGELVSTGGVPLGRHGGHQNFTIGQRKGVGLALGRPVYVVEIDPQANRVVLGEREQLLKRGLIAGGINLLCGRPSPGGRAVRCTARIRHNHAPAPAMASIDEKEQLRVQFDQPQTAITPGQAVVLYDGDVVLGGGWIERAEGDDAFMDEGS